MLKEGVHNKSINAPSDELLIEKLKGYLNNRSKIEDKYEELGDDEDEKDDDDQRRELGDDEDDEESEEMDDEDDY